MLKAIQLKDYRVIVSDEKGKHGDKFIGDNGIEVVYEVKDKSFTVQARLDNKGDQVYSKKLYGKLIAQSKQVHEGVPLFDAPWEKDVETLAKQKFPEPIPHNTGFSVGATLKQIGFIEGFKAAKEKYKWTDEDLLWFANYLRNGLTNLEYFLKEHKEHLIYWIQSLNKPKEYEVTIEEEFDKNLAPIVKSISNFVILAQNELDFTNKLKKMNAGNTEGFYTVENCPKQPKIVNGKVIIKSFKQI